MELFVLQFSPVCNFGKFLSFGTVRSERVKLRCFGKPMTSTFSPISILISDGGRIKFLVVTSTFLKLITQLTQAEFPSYFSIISPLMLQETCLTRSKRRMGD